MRTFSMQLFGETKPVPSEDDDDDDEPSSPFIALDLNHRHQSHGIQTPLPGTTPRL
jgi:hypothetical protein